MKKAYVAALLLAVLIGLWAVASAETVAEPVLEGLITEVGDHDFVLDDVTIGSVRVHLEDGVTAYEGIAAVDAMAVGQYVYVQYNGILTRSLPPQATALKVSCFLVSGTVGDILANGYTVEGDSLLGTVIVHMDSQLGPVYAGVPITLYYNGILALSMPPQLQAAHVVVPLLEGTASQVSGSGFTITDDQGTAYAISINQQTEMRTLPEDGEKIRVFYDGTLTAGQEVIALRVSLPSTDGDGAALTES